MPRYPADQKACDDAAHEKPAGKGKGRTKKPARKERQKSEAFEKLDKIITVTRQLPTIQLVDAVWDATFDWLNGVNKTAVSYLQKWYFKSITVDNMSKRFRCQKAIQGNTLWFGTFWSGIIGTYPGSASGTQTIESFHSSWQSKLKKGTRISPLEVFDHMQKIFEDDWSSQFDWDEEADFLTWPLEPAQELLNGQASRTVGRSPAVDFWYHREKKLNGCRNHFKIHRRTSGTDADGAQGITTFWVMYAKKKDGVAAAEATIQEAQAKSVTALIVSEGLPLQELLCKCGVMTEDSKASVNESRLQELFLDLAIVMQGDLPNSAWPRKATELDFSVDSMLCTCLPFLLHAECEHVLFVKALENRGINLKNVRVVQKKGRKRKFAPADSAT